MIRSNPEELIRKNIARFVDNEIIPIAQELDNKVNSLETFLISCPRWGFLAFVILVTEVAPAVIRLYSA